METKTQVLISKVKQSDYIILHFVDLVGYIKGRTIPTSKAESVLLKGVGFDGSSIPGFVNIEESDMVMKPDPKTLVSLPEYFYNRRVSSMICNIYRPGGERFEGDSRWICEKSIERIRREGYEPTAAAEVEFYVVKKKNGEIVPVEDHIIDHQRYFDICPGRDLTEEYRMDLSDALMEMGIDVERQHHEVGAAQSEITFKYSTPLITSDNIIRYRFAAKLIAKKKYGWIATFMPKPWTGRSGNGMHAHLGLFHRNGGNAFFDPDGYAGISQTCRYFVGGLMEHARALCAIVAPTVNSYKRLVPGYEAPVYISWSRRNRSALIRVPEYFPKVRNEARIEFRCPDPVCNPYLMYSVLFEAGMDGIKKKIDPGDPIEKNLYHLTDDERRRLGIGVLPKSLKEALEEFSSDDICVRALGKENAEKYIQLKMEEWKEYKSYVKKETNEVTKWELDKYLFL